MFLAPLLYALHAVLTGAAMVLMDLLGVRLGFGFSAGLFDYVINFGQATKPWLLLPVGVGYALVYYAVFRFCIVRFGLKTPGREDDAPVQTDSTASLEHAERAPAMIAALGGASNLVGVDACTTRLRLTVVRQDAVDEAALRRLGARGLVRPSANTLQVVLGPIADQVAGELRAGLRNAGAVTASRPEQLRDAPVATSPSGSVDPTLAARVLEALGGRANIVDAAAASTRVLVTLRDGAALDESRLHALDLRGVARPSSTRVHLLIGPHAAALEHELASAGGS
jgi:PTS system N-acetylglucosamine-specific IIC component